MAIQEREKMPVYSEKQAEVGALLFDKAPIEVSAEYSNYSDIFLVENAAELPKKSKMNKYAIKLDEGK